MLVVKSQSTPLKPAKTPERQSSAQIRRAVRKFLGFFPGGFRDETYLEWERDYKVEAHQRWLAVLDRPQFRAMLQAEQYDEIAMAAVRVESQTRHPMLFSFEKMALRDAVRSPQGAKVFARGLWDFLHGPGSPQRRFEQWCESVAALPRRQTRVLTWPMVTVFGFLAQPQTHIFLKPKTTRRAAEAYAFDLPYQSRPNWETYSALLDFADTIRHDLTALGNHLRPRDMIDIQSFMWVLGSDEYE